MQITRTRKWQRLLSLLIVMSIGLGLFLSPKRPFTSSPSIPLVYAGPPCNDLGNLIVSDGGNNQIDRFFDDTLLIRDTLINTGLANPHDMRIGPDNNLYIADANNGRIVRYDWATATVTEISTVPTPIGLTFGPDGALYVTSQSANAVYRVDISSGSPPFPASVFVTAGSGGLNSPYEGIEFGPDGNLYVVSNGTTHAVLRFNGSNGSFLNMFANANVSGSDPNTSDLRDIAFGPNGYLYTSESLDNRITYYDSSGTRISSFAANRAIGMAFAPNGELYVADFGSSIIRRFTATGTALGTFGLGNLFQPKALVFAAEPECYDYGDAPTTGSYAYPTLSAANGAYHLIRPSLFLGAGVDYDADGHPNLAALGDDSDNNDDEDGVDFGTLTAGAANNVTVTASAPCILNAWIDFDGDGSWSGVGEQVAADQWISGGANILTVNVPASPAEDVVGARFRCSSRSSEGNTVYSYTGYAPDGEVEDYMVAIGTDWGDAPDSYNTTSANNGASHTIVSNFHLGGIIDPETSGSDSVATGDDLLDNRDDEDGIDFVGNWADGTAEINVSLTGGRGCLNIWLDFTDGTNLLVNGDGDFLDTYTVGGTFPEHVVQNQAVDSANSPISLAFNIPAGIANGSTGYYLRARLTQDPNNDGNCADAGSEYSGGIVSHSGGATSGEVEDYYVDFEPTAVSLQTIGTESTAHNVFAIAGFALLLLGTAFAILRRQRFSD
ncbi:MAG: NHL repeat-containing protein [Ardenticatenaceae bacterium]|nr:NHL repeat-containing protein [Ardenticatenaceae bacterium]